MVDEPVEEIHFAVGGQGLQATFQQLWAGTGERKPGNARVGDHALDDLRRAGKMAPDAAQIGDLQVRNRGTLGGKRVLAQDMPLTARQRLLEHPAKEVREWAGRLFTVDACEYARFAPADDAHRLEDIYEKGIKVITAMDKAIQ